MKCACDDKECKSRLEWNTGTHSFRSVWGTTVPGQKEVEVLLFYDANALVGLIKEARAALNKLASGED